MQSDPGDSNTFPCMYAMICSIPSLQIPMATARSAMPMSKVAIVLHIFHVRNHDLCLPAFRQSGQKQ